MNSIRLHAILFGGSLALLAAVPGRAVDIGDAAPTLKGVKQWINGEAVDPAAAGGRGVTVVEFWATWSGPCRTTIPHLNELHARFKDRGVTIVGVTQEDEATVRPFMESLKMAYRVALDTDRSTEPTWMKDIEGIPHAFIVDGAGKIVWSGHTMDGLEEALDGVLDGTFDPEKLRRRREQEVALMRALQAGDLDQASSVLDRLIEADERNMELAQMKAGLLFQRGDLAALKAHYAAMLRTFHDSAEDLNAIAWMQAAPSPLPLHARDLGVAWSAARRAVELSGRKDAAMLDTLALVLFNLGLTDAAIATQEEALARAATDDERAELARPLEYFKAAKALAGDVARTLNEGK